MPDCLWRQRTYDPPPLETELDSVCRLHTTDKVRVLCTGDCRDFVPRMTPLYCNEEGLSRLVLKLVNMCVNSRLWNQALYWCEVYGMDVHKAAQLLQMRKEQHDDFIFYPPLDYRDHPGYVKND